MKKLWQKLKRWIIHKLGGYTWPEGPLCKIETSYVPLTTLTATYRVTERNLPFVDEEYLRDQILHGLSEQLAPFINIEKRKEYSMEYPDPVHIFYATIKIAERNKK